MGDCRGPGAGMGGVVTPFIRLVDQVRVDLGRAQALVARELLNAAQVGAVVEQVRGEAVAQRVGADAGVETR